MAIYDETLAANPQFRGAVTRPDGGFRLFGNPEQPNYFENWEISQVTGKPGMRSFGWSGDTTPVYSSMEELAKMKEEQEAAAFLLYGIAKKNAELMASEMPTPEGGKLMVPDPVIQQLAGEGYAENKRQIDMWYKTAKMKIENIGSSSLLNASEQYQVTDKLMIEINSKRPVIIPQSATMPTMQNIRMEAPQEQPAPEVAPAPSKFGKFLEDVTPESVKQLGGIINNSVSRAMSGMGLQVTETEKQKLKDTIIADFTGALQNKGRFTAIGDVFENAKSFVANKIAGLTKRFKYPVVKTETDYNALLKGARYIDGKTGDIKVKP